MTNDDSLNTKQAAAFLGVSARTISRLIRDREIPSITIRGRRTFSREGLERWKREREQESIARKRKLRSGIVSLVSA